MLKDSEIDENIDVKKIIFKVIGYWYYYLISIIICVALGFIVNKSMVPQYEVATSILIPENKELLNPEDLLGLASLKSESKVENEIGLLKTYSIVDQTIRSLNFYTTYYIKGFFNKRELYQEAPFEVKIDWRHPQVTGVNFELQFINDNEFIVRNLKSISILYSFVNDSIIDEKYPLHDSLVRHKFGDIIETDAYKFRIIKTIRYTSKSQIPLYYFTFSSPHNLVKEYSDYSINREAKSSILTLKINGQSPRKCSDFLNRLSEKYLSRGTEQKAKVADATINFINTQLFDIVDSLDHAESSLQNFQTSNSALHMDYQTELTLDAVNELEEKKADLEAKNRYYQYLQDYLKKSSNIDEIIAPSAMGIEDPLLSSLILDLSKLYRQKSDMKFNSKKDNLFIESVDQQIAETRSGILENVTNILHASKMSIEDIDNRINSKSSKLSGLPTTQRRLLTYERKSKLNGDLYTFLLQKRSESQIAKASNIPENQVIDKALVLNSKIISPRKTINLAISFILGLVIPSLLIFLTDFFGEKIHVAEDIEKSVKLPFLGYVVHNESESDFVFSDPHSVIAESFRGIRTNCEFIGKGADNRVILITSTVSGEGKTFFSLNLSISFALYEKRTLLLCFDLRKPVVYEDINTEQKMGLSSYLSGKTKLEEIIQTSKYENLDVILPGVIPPNPTELLASKRTADLFEILKSRYDLIIIDTPPIGILSDALLLVKYADINLFITRHNYTNKRLFVSVVNDLEKKELSNFHVVLNDMNIRKNLYRYGYSYKYGYGYGYGYGTGYGKYGRYGHYGNEKKRRGLWERIVEMLFKKEKIRED